MKQQYIITGAHEKMQGFRYLLFGVLSFVLLIVLVCLPVAPVFADESISESVDLASGSTSDEISTPTQIEQSESQVALDEAVVSSLRTEGIESEEFDAESKSSQSHVHDVNTEITHAEIDEPIDVISTEVTNVPDSTVELESITTQLLSENGEESTTTEIAPAEGEVLTEALPDNNPTLDSVVNGTTSEELLIEVSFEDTTQEDVVENINVSATNTVSVVGNMVTAISNDENKFTFSKDECTTVGDGTFYCATAKTEAEILHVDRIFSAPDADGDKEIYMERDGVLITLTDNQNDDDAPYFDEVANTIVWHRLIDGRYQIMQYNVDDNEEIQLTHDSFNNMQPRISGDTIVWQGWVGDDWEIFLSEKGSVRMLTDNTEHDIAPSINGNHIVWQSFEGEAWRMKVYDIRTGVIDTIENAEGGSIENPRFVLVYDTKLQSGDIETRGYDLESGEVVALSAKPIEVPDKIPDPDQTGEERALVSPSSQPKTKIDTNNDDNLNNTSDDESSVEPGDVVIPAFNASSTGEQSESIAIATTTPDLIIPAYETTQVMTEVSVERESIEDLVIEPYFE